MHPTILHQIAQQNVADRVHEGREHAIRSRASRRVPRRDPQPRWRPAFRTVLLRFKLR